MSLPVAWLAPAAQALLSAFAQTGPGRVALGEAGAHRVSGAVSADWSFGAGDVASAAITRSDRALHLKMEPLNPSNVR